MSRLQLNKSSLAQQSKSLKTFEKYLPSLDLKRQQLMTERANAKRELADLQAQKTQLVAKVKAQLPMLANHDVALDDFVQVTGVDYAQENVVGTRLPVVTKVHIQTKDYPILAKPHWVDDAVVLLAQGLILDINIDAQQQRLNLLNKAVVTITQRVNLFDKVLIPRAKANIKAIRIYLSDEQMTAVVRSKIAKRKRIGGSA